MRVRLPLQPYQLLTVLLERPGEVFTREELRTRLWPSDVFVDFDHGLNKSVQKLRDALNDSAEAPRYIETLPRTGYRFIAPVSDGVSGAAVENGTPAATRPILEAAASPPVGKRTHTSAMRWLFLALCTLLAAVLIAWFVERESHAGQIHSLAVLPLENLSGDPSQEYFADGMTDELITELARIPGLRVVSRTSVMQDKGKAKPLDQISRELRVDAIVEGSIVRSGNRVRITAQLIDTRDDTHLWAQSYEGRVSDILSLQDSVAREIAAQTKVALTPSAAAPAREIRTVDPEAHDAYLRGLYFLHRREATKSTEYFQRAVSIDPNYASAYAGLALALISQNALGNSPGLDVVDQGLAAARHAIELDPTNGQAYSVRGLIETFWKWDWTAAEQDLKRGIELSPSDSLNELQYVAYLDAMGRSEEAITHMRRALDLDPLSFFMNRHMGSALFFGRHYDEALDYLNRAGEMEPDHLDVVENWKSWIDEKRGLLDQAVTSDLLALPKFVSGSNLDALRATYRQHGWKAYQQAKIDLLTPYAREGCVPYEIGLSNLRLGYRDRAVASFNQAIDNRCLWMVWMKVDPMLDDLRGDARFHSLLRRLNLPE